MQLKLSKSVIRSFRLDDAVSLTKHIGNYSVARNMAVLPHPYTLENADEWLARATTQEPQTHFAITIDDEVVGGIGLELPDPARMGVSRHVATVGYWLGETFWGRGIMSEAVAAFTDWGFTTLDLVRIDAVVYARNPASARVLAKAGFEFEGRLRARYFKEGEFLDGLLFAKIRERKPGCKT
jgi:RimJ/RimL family protein N-acetyltransferase